MASSQEDFKGAVRDILEVVMFENWLRFYFIAEEPKAGGNGEGAPALWILVPPKGMEKIGELYPGLLPLAEDVNDKPVDFETSRRAVLTFTLNNLDGKKMPRQMAQNVFSSRAFQVELQLFHTWAQLHEAQLDQEFMDFGRWRAVFAEWRNGKGARDLAAKLEESLAG